MKRPSPSLLETRILALAETFTRDLLAALRRGSLLELHAATFPPVRAAANATPASTRTKPRKRTRSANRTPADIAGLVNRIVGAVTEAAPHALSGGEIRAHLGLTPSAFARPIREAVEGGQIATRGKVRLTEYVSARAPQRAKTYSGQRKAKGHRQPAREAAVLAHTTAETTTIEPHTALAPDAMEDLNTPPVQTVPLPPA